MGIQRTRRKGASSAGREIELVTAKRARRQRILAVRDKLTVREINLRSRKIIAALKKNPAFITARRISVYVSFRSEVRTVSLIKELIAAEKKTVYLPRVVPPRKELAMVRIKDSTKDLAPGIWGILEPLGDLPPLKNSRDLDLVIVPGLAFDKTGNRLGYGGGYYDRFLKKLEKVPKIGLAYSFQMINRLPTSRTDIKMDYVITDQRVWYFNRLPEVNGVNEQGEG